MSGSTSVTIPKSMKPLGPPDSEGWVRCSDGCPNCGQSTKNHHFMINVKGKTQQSYCHKCGESWNGFDTAKIMNSFSGESIKVDVEDISNDDKERMKEASTIYRKVKRSNKNSKTLAYLEKRGIPSESVKELPLYDYDDGICIHGFSDEKENIVAIHKYLAEGKRYSGKKSFGLGVLRKGDTILVSEGLVNLLSVNSILYKNGNTSLGLVTVGDAGNLKKLVGTHSWLVRKARKVILVSDYDRLGAGQDAAMSVAREFPAKVEVLMPPSLGQDWNDLLVAGTIERYL